MLTSALISALLLADPAWFSERNVSAETFRSVIRLQVDEAAIAATPAPVEPRRLLVYTQAGCPPCAAMLAGTGTGDSELELEWVARNVPAWVRSFPTIHDPVRNRYLSGQQDLATLRQWVGLPRQSTLMSGPPIAAGSVSGREQLEQALSHLRILIGDRGSLTTGQGELVWQGLPLQFLQPTKLMWELGAGSGKLTFEKPYPVVRYGRIGQAIEGVEYTGSQLVLKLPGWLPDWSLKVND